MNKGWQTKKLEEIGKTQTGSTPKTSDQSNYGDFISFVKPGDFNTDGTLDYDKDGLSESGAEGARIVPAGSVLMVCIGATIGKCGYCDQDITTNQQVNALTPNDGSSNRFIYYQMLTETFQRKVIHASGQATLPIINKSKWSALSVWLPPKVAEQKRIVGLLDEAFEGIATAKANAEKNLQNARALFESHLHFIFTQRGPGWVEKSIGGLCERLHQGLNTAGEKVKFYESGYPIIQTRNIDDGVVELDSKMKFMSEEDWNFYKDKYRPEIGDVFFTNIGTIGKTAIVTTDRDYLIHWNIFKLRPLLGKITSEFLRYTLEQLTLSGYFEKLQKGGTVDFVTKKMISEALIQLPDIAEQKTIIAKLDDLRKETRRLALVYERKLTALESLKRSLLQQAFTGKL